VSDGPLVLCEMPQTSLTLGDTLLVICKARFNPAPIATYWQFNVDDVLHKLHQGHTFKEFSARKQVCALITDFHNLSFPT
jgi:hypothetical protein